MTYAFRMLEPQVALHEWSLSESFLKAALEEDQYTLISVADLLHGVRRNDSKLWHIYRDTTLVGAFVTEHVRGSKGGAINIVALGGNEMPLWIDQFSREMVRYAKELRCLYVCEMGRQGWTRVLDGLGWIAPSRVMLKLAI